MPQMVEIDFYAHNNIYKSGYLDGNYRKRTVHTKISVPQSGTNEDTGMLLLLPGYGGNIGSNVFHKMLLKFSDWYNLVVVQCDYFGNHLMDTNIPDKFKENANEIMKTAEHMLVAGELLYEQEPCGTVDEFNDMGIMQALDIVSTTMCTLSFLSDQGAVVNTNKIIMFGISHGAYIGHIANLICPNLYSCLIDITSYLFPFYKNNNRMITFSDEKIKISVRRQEFLYAHPEYQYAQELYDLRFLYKNAKSKCKIIAFQGTEDWMVDYKEKAEFVSQIGETAQLMLISKEDVDGIMCKSADHGLGMDFMELFKMLMPMLDNLLREKSCNINLSEEVMLGDDENHIKITYENGLPELISITPGQHTAGKP